MKKRVVIFGGTFGPITLAHIKTPRILAEIFDLVVVWPCGSERTSFDKPSVNDTEPVHRAAMMRSGLKGIKKVKIDFTDFEQQTFTRSAEQVAKYEALGYEVWMFVGSDLVENGASGQSKIHKDWRNGRELWNTVKFVVDLSREGSNVTEADLPPNHMVINVNCPGSSTEVRKRVFARQPIDHLVTKEVAGYIKRNGLYLANGQSGVHWHKLPEQPRIMVVPSKNPAIQDKINEFLHQFSALIVRRNPDAIMAIGGDGTLLEAVKKYWRLHVPFFGVNFGDAGFMMNAKEGFLRETLNRDFRVYHCPFLQSEMTLTDGSIRTALAFNDVRIEKLTDLHHTESIIFQVKAKAEGLDLDVTMKGNGAILATPAGSTAYSMSAGGHEIMHGSPMLALTGICVGKPLHWRSGPISINNARVEFVNADPSGRRKIIGICDSKPIGFIDRVVTTVSQTAAAEIMLLPESSLAAKLALKQYPREFLCQGGG